MLWRNSAVAFYVLLTASILASFYGELRFDVTTGGVVVGTLIATVGSVVVSALPAYVMAGALVGLFPIPRQVRRATLTLCYVMAGMPSIVIGVIGFLVFAHWLGFGWSLLSAILTLLLLLLPTLTTAFVQILTPVYYRYSELARAMSITPLEFAFRSVPRYCNRQIVDTLVFGWTRALGDTAAVMLTCGALLDMPSSLLDSVRLLNYHIFLLAMDIPGGMPEARALSFLLIIILFILLMVPRLFLCSHGSQPSRNNEKFLGDLA